MIMDLKKYVGYGDWKMSAININKSTTINCKNDPTIIINDTTRSNTMFISIILYFF